ncbi:DgyrCDS9867 [Dimorphilus gyrociliatus]|uniref:UDP-N-acetylglucosamine transferase subunit ALG13 n=1 Tax=Dimorphilus gyrociliatus TaxID=2664684 RepID=A0A7I8VZP4_9ANNE|nr:DgyrCDS9867 [Dimorphilus gyrociliatus]
MLAFVTVGTTSFNDLIREVCSDQCLKALKKRGFKKLLLQIGRGTFIPDTTSKILDVEYYKYKNKIIEDINKADLVISHAGAGTSLEVLTAKKHLLVVVNDNLMNNHQLELADQLQKEGFCYYTNCQNLAEYLSTINLSDLKPYIPGNPELFISFLDEVTGIKSLST